MPTEARGGAVLLALKCDPCQNTPVMGEGKLHPSGFRVLVMVYQGLSWGEQHCLLCGHRGHIGARQCHSLLPMGRRTERDSSSSLQAVGSTWHDLRSGPLPQSLVSRESPLSDLLTLLNVQRQLDVMLLCRGVRQQARVLRKQPGFSWLLPIPDWALGRISGHSS